VRLEYQAPYKPEQKSSLCLSAPLMASRRLSSPGFLDVAIINFVFGQILLPLSEDGEMDYVWVLEPSALERDLDCLPAYWKSGASKM
jgi:hypothetical protein